MATLWRALEGEGDRHEESGGGPLRGNVADYRRIRKRDVAIPCRWLRLYQTLPSYQLMQSNRLQHI